MSEGWICPICGRALAPWVSECPCYLTKTVTSNSFMVNGNIDGKCDRVCGNKTELGYCRTTACIRHDLGGDPNYGIGNGV